MLAEKPRNLNAIADGFDVSRPAVSKHVKILVECGLVQIRREGRERVCEVRFERLAEVSDWLEPYRRHWEDRLQRLEDYLKTLQKPNSPPDEGNS